MSYAGLNGSVGMGGLETIEVVAVKIVVDSTVAMIQAVLIGI